MTTQKSNQLILTVPAFVLLLLFPILASAQYPRSFVSSNYAGLYGASFNPATLADSRHRFSMIPLSAYADVTNNFIRVVTPYNQVKALKGNLPESQLDENGYPMFNNSMIDERLNGNKKQFYAATEITEMSMMFGLPNKMGVAFAAKTRVFANLSGLNEDLMKIFLEDFDTTGPNFDPREHQLQYLNQPNVLNGFSIGGLAYQELGFSFANVLIDNKSQFLKGGVTLKYLVGLGGYNFSIKELDYELIGYDSIRFNSIDADISYIDDRYYTNSDQRVKDYFGSNRLGRGIALDVGVVYEYRPNYNTFFYRMDRREHEDRTANKYLYKVGASIADFGRIKFNNAGTTKTMHLTSDGSVDWHNFNSFTELNGVDGVDSFFYELFPKTDSTTAFSANLPTSLNLFFDYQLTTDWFLSASYIQSLRTNQVKGVRKQNVLTTSIRYETRKFEAAANFMMGKFYTPLNFGGYVRWGPIFIGADNLGGVLTRKRTNGMNVWAGVQLPILHNTIPDRDFDQVSDDKDQCPDLAGSERAKGCPDRDGDREPDASDRCPDVPGERSLKGCPDPDGDGLIAEDDKCPDVFGLKQYDGCPDTDDDGVPDYKDMCPEVEGSIEYEGCPFEVVVEVEVEVETKPIVEVPKLPGKEIKTVADVVEVMNFAAYDYYLILGAYQNKELADLLVRRLNKEAVVLTYIYFDEEKQINYVTFGRATSRIRAFDQLKTLDNPGVNLLINGHVWWKKVPK
ncbi:MAG: hypothetical protein ACI8ZN_001385 [Bacteroidia bacterium]